MEGWRQERLGSRAGTHREEEKKTSLQEEKEKKQKNTLDSYRPSHGRGFYGAIYIVAYLVACAFHTISSHRQRGPAQPFSLFLRSFSKQLAMISSLRRAYPSPEIL